MEAIEHVLSSRMCIGCGACAVARPDRYAVAMTPDGHFRAERLAADEGSSASRVCPMSGAGANETEIAAGLWPELPFDPEIGRHRSTLAAHVVEGEFRARGSSGGMISWILAELLRRGEVDAVLHVRPVDPAANHGRLFGYAVSKAEAEIAAGAKSRYYPIEMSAVLAEVQRSSKRFAVVGVPCFIKAVRLLQAEGVITSEQTPYTVGLICGHLKSRYFADYLAWQKGVEPGALASFDFRRKLPGRQAGKYGFAFRQVAGDGRAPADSVWPMTTSPRGRDWGGGMFKNPACEFCDDVVAECADVAVGDAWLPGYVEDWRGANVVVTRSAVIDGIIAEGAASGAIAVDPISAKAVIASQASGLRHRREGLAHRLARRVQRGAWIPAKRVEPRLAPTLSRRLVYDARQRIAETSSALFGRLLRAGKPLAAFERRIGPLYLSYKLALRADTLLSRFRARGRPAARRGG